jgi:hypothetical protein
VSTLDRFCGIVVDNNSLQLASYSKGVFEKKRIM